MDLLLSNLTLHQNMSSDEFHQLNASFYEWLNFSRYNESCIIDLLPANFQTYKYFFISGYCVLLFIGAIENISALKHLLTEPRRNIANTMLLINLTIANMIVTFAIIPIEVAWRVSLSWPTGEIGCKGLQFVRALGPYLSSMILIGVSLDRYLVLTRPFSRDNRWRKGVIGAAWALGVLFSLPQSIIFHLERHPVCAGFIQCVSLYYFKSEDGLKIYNLASLTVLYVIPLIVIIYCYSFIIITIVRHTEELQRLSEPMSASIRVREIDGDGRSIEVLSMSNQAAELNSLPSSGILSTSTKNMRLRDRRYRATVKKTLIIIVAFVVCWTPFVFLIFLTQVYPSAARNINPYVKDLLLMFAVSNSCVNPLVYGTHTSLFARVFLKVRRAWT